MNTIDYILSGAFVSGAVTNISGTGVTYQLLDYGSPKPNQQWIGTVTVVTAINNDVEDGIEVHLKFDEADAGQLDVYAYPFTRFNGKTWRGDNYLSEKLHHPITQISGTTAIHNVTISGVTNNTLSIIRP